MMKQLFNVLVGLNRIDKLIKLLGAPSNMRQQITCLNNGGGQIDLAFQQIKTNKKRHAIGLDKLANKTDIAFLLFFRYIKINQILDESNKRINALLVEILSEIYEQF
jgi:hypothetical protein